MRGHGRVALLILALLQAGGASRVSGRTPNETPCAACAFGPVTLRGGAPQPYTFNFPGEVDRIAELWVQVTGQATVEAAFRLNGEFVGEGQGALVPLRRGLSRYPADLQTFNVLEVFLGQDTVGRIRLLVRYRGRTPPLDRPCPPDGPVLSHLPANLDRVVGIVPLGSVNPPEHTFPTHHVYFYAALPGASGPPVPVEI